MTPKDPFLEGTFWDKFWRPIRSRALLFTPEFVSPRLDSLEVSRSHDVLTLVPLASPYCVLPRDCLSNNPYF